VRGLFVAGSALVVCFALGLGACAAVVEAATGNGGGTPAAAATSAGVTGATGSTPSTASEVGPLTPIGGTAPAVPPDWESVEQAAAVTSCTGLDWAVLAAIGRVESDSGRSTLPGVTSGANADGAEGPMQFEPGTFAEYAVSGPGGATPPSPYDPVDAVYTAAHLLCANGAGSPAGLYGSIWDYDHTQVYVETVLVLSHALGADPQLGSEAASAIAFAAGKLGVPYVWGGTGPDGYDCSGLVQAAYRAAGVALPRVAQTQFDAGPVLAPLTPPLPGDLVFFGTASTAVSHVGIYIGGGEMIDAPHTGTVVRVDATPTTPGARFGDELLVGETRPWAG
jgi:cell wall-associated NlpC family hydrolase